MALSFRSCEAWLERSAAEFISEIAAIPALSLTGTPSWYAHQVNFIVPLLYLGLLRRVSL